MKKNQTQWTATLSVRWHLPGKSLPSSAFVRLLKYMLRALLTLDIAIPHLNHFCAVIPSGGQDSHVPIYELDPPDYVEGWHMFQNRNQRPYEGPWGATVTLPRALPAQYVHPLTRVDGPY